MIICQTSKRQTVVVVQSSTMEIVKANAAFLSNYEVMKILQELKDGAQKKHKREGSLATVTYETLHYLQGTDCKKQSKSKIEQLMTELKPYNLTKTEKLMLLNNPPRSALEIQLFVQESEERLTEQQVEEIINIFEKIFPSEEEDS